MYILDTNVISDLRRASSGKANAGVVSWAAQQKPSSLFISVITVMEIEMGILSIERRDEQQGAMLRTWFDESVRPTFTQRILGLDEQVAIRCARLHVPDRKSERDAIIAATALQYNMVVVTQNEKDFQNTGVEIINPWRLKN